MWKLHLALRWQQKFSEKNYNIIVQKQSNIFKSNERSEYSYIGLADFFCFQEKVLKFVHAQF